MWEGGGAVQWRSSGVLTGQRTRPHSHPAVLAHLTSIFQAGPGGGAPGRRGEPTDACAGSWSRVCWRALGRVPAPSCLEGEGRRP